MSESQEDIDCHDLRNIQYKTMLMNGKNLNINNNSEINSTSVEKLLDEEMKLNRIVTWARLDKGEKIRKLNIYADNYCKSAENSCKDSNLLKQYFLSALDRNRLQKVKEVKYNKETGVIENIPDLVFNTATNRFTLNRNDKRASTLSSLGDGNTTRKKRTAKKTVDKIEVV
jgi:hypothetical protein